MDIRVASGITLPLKAHHFFEPCIPTHVPGHYGVHEVGDTLLVERKAIVTVPRKKPDYPDTVKFELSHFMICQACAFAACLYFSMCYWAGTVIIWFLGSWMGRAAMSERKWWLVHRTKKSQGIMCYNIWRNLSWIFFSSLRQIAAD